MYDAISANGLIAVMFLERCLARSKHFGSLAVIIPISC